MSGGRCIPCAKSMCHLGHKLDPFAGNCFVGDTHGKGRGEGSYSLQYGWEDGEKTEGMEDGEGSSSFGSALEDWEGTEGTGNDGSYSYEFVFGDWEGTKGRENGDGSYSFEFVPVDGSPHDSHRCGDLACCTGTPPPKKTKGPPTQRSTCKPTSVVPPPSPIPSPPVVTMSPSSPITFSPTVILPSQAPISTLPATTTGPAPAGTFNPTFAPPSMAPVPATTTPAPTAADRSITSEVAPPSRPPSPATTTAAPTAADISIRPEQAHDTSSPPYTDSPTQVPEARSVWTVAPTGDFFSATPTSGPTGSPTSSPTSAPTSAPTSTDFAVDAPPNVEVDSAASTAGVDDAISGGAIAAGTFSFLAALAVLLAGAASMAGGGSSSNVSLRAPAETMVFMVVSQLQFLATLSMVDSTADDDSFLSEFVTNLRWTNLWWEVDVVSSSASEDADVVSASVLRERGRGPPPDGDEMGTSSVSEQCEDAAESIGLLVGTITLFSAILLGVFLVHLVGISVIQAYWVAKENALANVEHMRQRGIPISEQIALRSGETDVRNMTYRDGIGNAGGEDVSLTSEQARLGPIALCRNRSQSAWLHFPHLELLFLFFAFEGVVAAAAELLEHSGCPQAFYPALILLVIYPILMVMMLWRTIKLRIHPDAVLVFNYYDDEGDTDTGDASPSTLSKMKTSLVDDCSLFAWADRGEWETTGSEDPKAVQEGNWFRIGFEPMFVDYTKTGTYFILISLAYWAALACVGVLVSNSTLQLVVFCALSSIMVVILGWMKPFANTAVNTIAMGIEATDAACMGLMAVSSYWWNDSDDEDWASGAVVLIQFGVLCVLIIPVYVDSVTSLVGIIGHKVKRAATKTDKAVEKEEKRYVRSHIRRTWGSLWCTMLRYNMFAWANDTRQGVRNPTAPPAAS